MCVDAILYVCRFYGTYVICMHVLNRTILQVAAVAVTVQAQPNQTRPLQTIRAAGEHSSPEAQYELGWG